MPYRPRESHLGKTPEARARQLANLWKGQPRAKTRPKAPPPLQLTKLPNPSIWLDPVEAAQRLLDVRLWSRQQDFLLTIRDNALIACRSGNALGKSRLLAVAALLWVMAYASGIVVITSSSKRQLKILFREISRLYRGAGLKKSLGGTLNTLELKISDESGIYGVNADPNQPENLGGYHSEHVLCIVDEASALQQEHLDALLGNAVSPDDKVVLSGNPLRPSGVFFDAFSSSDWKTLKISSLENPNITVLEPFIAGLATKEWVERRRNAWGETSPAYQARVLGEFPAEGEDTLIPLSWIEAATEREHPRTGGVFMGVDVARFGSDKTVFCIRDSKSVLHMEATSKQDTMATCGRLIALKRSWGVEKCYVDDVALGGGLVDRLKELKEPNIMPTNFGSSPKDTEQFLNRRIECYWQLRLAMADLAIPERYKTEFQELASIRYAYTSNGKLKLESKDEIKRRLGRSPDYADALALSFGGEGSPKRAGELFTISWSDAAETKQQDHWSGLYEGSLGEHMDYLKRRGGF